MNHTWHTRLLSSLALGAAAILPGCTHHTIDVQPIRVEPIHLTVDVNVKVDRELDRFFDFEQEGAAAATQPASTTAAAPSAPSTQGVSP